MTPHSTQDYQGFRLHDTGRNLGSGPVPGPTTGAANKPQIVGIWRLLQKIHAGNWCDIFAAQPADASGSPRYDYAVKIARTLAPEHLEVTRQLRAEVEVARVARHPHLVPVLDADLQGSRPFIVMPRLEARTLSDILGKVDSQRASQPIPVSLWWVRQVAQALQSIHDNGWIHGDIKPENILVDSRGHVTLIDLGFAQSIGAASDQCFRGTPDYAAPEQLAGGVASPKSDIFSLGTVLLRLLPKQQECPAAILELVDAMCSKAIEQRPAARELCEQLLQLEIDNLHLHLCPENVFPKKAA